LYESKTLVETGHVVYGGGGVALPLGARGSARSDRIGLRVDVRAMAFWGGISLDNSTRVSAEVAASVYAGF
jgi:hypothetical protein